MVEAIIFDMDGVIVDSERHWRAREKKFVYDFIPSEQLANYRKRFVGLVTADIYDILKTDFNIPTKKEDFINEFDSVAEDVYMCKSSMLPHCLEFLKAMRKSSLKIGLASSSPMSWIDMAMKRFDLTKFFDVIVSATDLDIKGKPAPDVYLITAKKLGIPSVDCIAIEDSRNGVLSAKGAGMKCIGMRNGFNDDQDLSTADFIIHDFSELSVEKIKKM
ncbi:MAG: HAD family phosphatase [Candidatus Aenigmatarchaeota archaeon]